MPLISRFFGIAIYMYYDDHAPPHFHAIYGDEEGLIDIRQCNLISGRLSPRVLGLVIEWASYHKEELLEKLGPWGADAVINYSAFLTGVEDSFWSSDNRFRHGFPYLFSM